MHLDKIIGTTDDTIRGIMRSYLDEPGNDESDWKPEELLDYVNMEHRHLFSVVRNYNEDWFGRTNVFALANSTYEYYLPLDCVNPARLEIIRAASVTGTSPNFVVNEETAEPQEVHEINLSDRGSVRRLTANANFLFGTGYHLFDEKIIFEPNDEVNNDHYIRLWYFPQAPDLHRGTAQSGTTSTITLAADGGTGLLGTTRIIDNYYQYMRIEIISGTGAGQIRRITQYVGSTRVATITPNWTTTPTSSSIYSIVSPIQEDYQELLALGGCIRAKGIKVEDDTSIIVNIYSALKGDMTSALEKRSHQRTRHVTPSTRRLRWY